MLLGNLAHVTINKMSKNTEEAFHLTFNPDFRQLQKQLIISLWSLPCTQLPRANTYVFQGGIRVDIQQLTNGYSQTSFSFLKVSSIHSLMHNFLDVLYKMSENEIVIEFSIQTNWCWEANY